MQTIMAFVVVGLLGWAGFTLQEVQKQMAGMSAQMAALQSEVTNLRQLNQDRYPNSQATLDWARNRQEIDEIRGRLRELEKAR